ncbi:MAG: LysR family transcriptional regulator [bacterium]|nr:LysR family transcriptional regulator [bacterium]
MENNLSLYRIFYAAAICGNISNAAKSLYISQPAVSKAISKLEQSLNVILFIRSPKGVQLTYEGELLFEKIKIAFESIELGEEQIRRTTELGGGHIKVGVSTTLCKYVLLPYLQEFIQENPHVKFTINCQSTYQTLQLLEEGKMDIGFIGIPKDAKEHLKNLNFVKTGEIEDIFVTTKSYMENLKIRVADHSHSSILQNATLMLLDKPNMTRQYIDAYFAEHHFEPGQLIEVTTMDLLIDFAKIGLGVACVIEDFVKKELESKELIQVPLKFSIPKRSIGFAVPKANISSNATERFADFITKHSFA